jgi:hypothetical protein
MKKQQSKMKHGPSLVQTGTGAVMISASLQLIQCVEGHVRQCTNTSHNGIHSCQLPSGYPVPSIDISETVYTSESPSYKYM